MSSLRDISKYICFVLRHHPEDIDISLDNHGWANVDELIAGIARSKDKEFNRETLEMVVREDNKQRYSFNSDGTKIRANQGHSIPVDVELEKREPPEILYHGTAEKYVESINKEGLISKSRLYVHLGNRHGKPVIYEVASREMYNDGYDFFISVNGVWLTKEVPIKYLRIIQ